MQYLVFLVTFLLFTPTLFSTNLFALEIPNELRQLLIQKNKGDVLARFEQLDQKSNQQIITTLEEKPLHFLGAGFNGVGFDVGNDVVYKIAHHVVSSNYKEHQLWRNFLLQKQRLGHLDKERDFNKEASIREIYGNLLYEAYNPTPEINFLPLDMTEDSMVVARTKISGVPLSEILKAERDQKIDGKSVPFNMAAVWSEVCQHFKTAEKMLLETGLAVDTLNPSNFLVQELEGKIKVVLIDHELIRPSKETFDFYKHKNQEIHQSDFSKIQADFVYWPLMPEQAVFNRNWSLDFDQSVAFIQSYFNYSSREQAIRHLASLEEYPIDFYPPVQNFENIKIAKQKHCEAYLTHF